jgi:TPR repeat protein
MILTALSLSGAENTPQTIPQQLLNRARQGEAQAQLEAGFVYYKLNNPVLAAYWFNAAASQGVAEAQYNLGRCYMAGYGVEKNLHRALELFKTAALKELPQAELLLSELLLAGIASAPDATPPRAAVAPNEAAALQLLEKLTRQGSAEAMTVHAQYLIKKYPEQQKHRIIELLKTASGKEHLPAMITLADYLLNRTNELRDEKLARQLLQSASAQSREALIKYAFAMENGFGAPPDPAAAAQLYKECLDKEFSPLAAVRMANFYYTGSYGIEQNIAKAFALYTRSAAAGVPEAIYRLGECYRNGIGTAQDQRKAFELLFQAARRDYPLAQYAVGSCLANGEGTPQDESAAFYWFNQAAMRFEPRSMLEVGKRYLYGNGVKKDPVKAAAFLEQALANGMNEAKTLLDKALQEVSSTPETPQLPAFTLAPQQ